jgi:(aminoalkyl)phosphonate N-acetyltransferase
MTQPTLRKTTVGDAEAVRSLVEELGYGPLDPQTFSLGLEAVLADPSQQLLVAEADGQVVGFMSLDIKPQVRLVGLVATIDELVVAERARGMGIGKKLVEFAKAEALRTGARRLELHTARKRPSYERAFYVKNGFTEVDSAVMRWLERTSAEIPK